MLSVIGDDRNRLPIISSQHPNQGRAAPGLKGNTVSDLECQHLSMRAPGSGSDGWQKSERECLSQQSALKKT